jgi:diguanylate cyclase (GGDEF)-like protein
MTAHERDKKQTQGSDDARGMTASTRLVEADDRDETAVARDVAATARDVAADARDRAIDEDSDPAAAGQRAAAGHDRQAAAADRRQAASERNGALVDRQALARELEIAAVDPLTGARMRAAGLVDLEREVERSRRTGSALVVAYVDVIGLKEVNDGEGHAAGDRLLQQVVAAIKEHLRSYDLVIRLGGDEFLCALNDVTAEDARRRFGEVSAALAAAATPAAITTGIAAFVPDESGSELINRADDDLIARRGAGH